MDLVFDSTVELIRDAAARFRTKVATGQLRRVLLTGGSLGIELLRELAQEHLDISGIDFFFGDERYVELNHPDRNEAQGIAAWPNLTTSLKRFPANDSDLTLAAARISSDFEAVFGPLADISPVFDLVILGMGPDGHVASLFPGHDYPKTWVVAEPNSPKPPSERLSFSYQALNRATEVWFLVSGSSKSNAVRCAKESDCDLPVAKVHGLSETLWFMDQELRRAL